MRVALISFMTFAMSIAVSAQTIERVEPLNWWIGMETPLQLMFYGEELSDFDVRCETPGVRVTEITKVENPNYLFVDILIDSEAKAGEYRFVLDNGVERLRYPYRLEDRREGSANRESFSSKDVLYLLMPDRFANGDPSNDNIDGCPDRLNREDSHGRHGGDIAGIIDHLDYISELGATTIWSTPLTFDNDSRGSYHGYATTDYYKIDPRFGDNNLYRKMVEEAHLKGLKVIMDMVPNHCGLPHWWMDDLPFDSWINHNENPMMTNHAFSGLPDPNASQRELEDCYTGWFVPSMPDINMEEPLVLQYFKQMAIWWVEWADLDGLRVDTFAYTERNAIASWVEAILNEYPNLRIVGECWLTSPAQVAYWDGATRNNDGYSSNLPSVMDFPLQEAIVEGLAKDTIEWGEGLNRVYNVLTHDFVYKDPRTLLIFAANHDTDRLAYFLKSNPKKVNLAMTMVATMRGIPQLYVGDELLFLGDQSLHHGGQRIDFIGGWEEDDKNLFLDSDLTSDERMVRDHIKQIFNWRKTSDVIHSGKTLHFVPYDNFYVYFRYTEEGSVMVLVNASQIGVDVDWNRFSEGLEKFSGGVDIVTGKRVKLREKLTVNGLSSMIIELHP